MYSTLPAVPVYLGSGVSWTTIKAVWRDNDNYCGLADNLDETVVMEAAECVELDSLLEEDQLCGEARDSADVSQETLAARPLLVEAVDHVVPITKKQYMDLLHGLIQKIQRAQRDSDATTRQLSEKEERIGRMELTDSSINNDSVAEVHLKEQLAAWDVQIAVLEESAVNLNTSLIRMTQSHGASRTELESARTAIARCDRVFGISPIGSAKDYSSLVRAQSTRYCGCLNAVLADAQLKRSFLGGFLIGVSEDGHSIHIGSTDSDIEQEVHTVPSSTDSEDVKVVPPPAGHL